MEINGMEINGKKFAYDGCHKIYVLANDIEEAKAKKSNYEIHDISEIKSTYEESCELKFISSWDLTTSYAMQGRPASFK